MKYGQPAVLHCNYDLEGDELYSVKYYKDYVEFYRYLPNDAPRAAQKFQLKGAYVDVSQTHFSRNTTFKAFRYIFTPKLVHNF